MTTETISIICELCLKHGYCYLTKQGGCEYNKLTKEFNPNIKDPECPYKKKEG